jgi:hypothetical protein
MKTSYQKFIENSNPLKIQLAQIDSVLNQQLGESDTYVAEFRKYIPLSLVNLQKGLDGYNDIISKTNQYIPMAKTLGNDTMLANLVKIQKNANEMVKICNTSITKLKSL